jgi:hypothetical protein
VELLRRNPDLRAEPEHPAVVHAGGDVVEHGREYSILS